MISTKLDYSSKRSHKARASVLFSSMVIKLLILAMIAILLSGLGLLLISQPLGWMLVGLSFIPAMLIEWYNGELKNLAPTKSPKSIDDIMSGELLGRLSSQPSTKEIVNLISQMNDGHFMAVRFGISPSFLNDVVQDEQDLTAIFSRALEIYNGIGADNLSAAILLVAIIDQNPHCKILLNHLQLDGDDLIEGIKWLNHINRIKLRDSKKLSGGIARDWSFGWTPLLNRFSTNISQQVQGGLGLKLTKNDSVVQKMIGILSDSSRQNIALVGPVGSGKTEIVSSLAEKLLDGSNKLPNSLKYSQIYSLDAANLISAASDRGSLEQLVPRILVEAYNARNIILCLDNAQLFFSDGIGSVDISNILAPVIEAGRLRMILIFDDKSWLKLSQENSGITNSLNRLLVEPSSRTDTIAILQEKAIIYEYHNKVIYMYQSLKEVYRLSERYVYDLSQPQKAIKLLEMSAQYSENGLVTAKSVQQAIEKTMNVKIGRTDNQAEKDKLLQLEDLIHQRMINQVKAVSVVSDALRRARAGVRNQNRPIGTFLFLGPTGVGKTELAKSLAAIYFDGEDNIIRLDMNEYSKASDVSRLINSSGDNSNSLISQITKKPFSVVLLDEIEKAHVNVLASLLQMLDEGIMRDDKDREISFRDCLVIATSNAGSNQIREYIERGYDINKIESQLVDGLIKSGQFSPEFINRFDETVVFRPLGKDELIQVVDLMIKDVNQTLALQKISVTVDKEAKEYLVEAGYDPRLGARPMRRIVQRTIESSVAKMMLAGEVDPGTTINIDFDQVKSIIDKQV